MSIMSLIWRRNYYEKNVDKMREAALRYKRAKLTKVRVQDRVARRTRHQQNRLLVLTKYGGRCVCCGETALALLCVDHVHNNGKEHRARVGGNDRVYVELMRSPRSPDFQVLCFSCNMGKHLLDVCPHQTPRRVFAIPH